MAGMSRNKKRPADGLIRQRGGAQLERTGGRPVRVQLSPFGEFVLESLGTRPPRVKG